MKRDGELVDGAAKALGEEAAIGMAQPALCLAALVIDRERIGIDQRLPHGFCGGDALGTAAVARPRRTLPVPHVVSTATVAANKNGSMIQAGSGLLTVSAAIFGNVPLRREGTGERFETGHIRLLNPFVMLHRITRIFGNRAQIICGTIMAPRTSQTPL
ncbi:MAG: hypothetical protein WBF47_02200 [Xanthobacteraceae bacterium]